MFDDLRERKRRGEDASLSCDPPSFMHWAVTVSLKNEISLQEMEKFRRAGASIWKNCCCMKVEEELLLLLFGISEMILREAGTVRAGSDERSLH